MDFLHRICDWLEYLGGQRDSVPEGFPPRRGWLVRGLWWGLMAVLIAIFCGQGSKFLYIDF
jgi:hypothetical protein